jgi:hypothetical protein
MVTQSRRFVTMGALALAATLGVMTVSEGSGWHRRNGGEVTTDPGLTPYTAFRPPYYGEPARHPLFLGGYAGYNYGRAPHAGYAVPPQGAAPTPPFRRSFLPWRR